MDTRRGRFLFSGHLLIPFKLEVGILLGVGAYSNVGADSVTVLVNGFSGTIFRSFFEGPLPSL